MILTNIILIFLLISLNAFFVAVEFSVVASRRPRLDNMEQADTNAGRLVRVWLDDPGKRNRLIAANQLAITLVGLALGAIGENTFQAILGPLFSDVPQTSWLRFLEDIFPVMPLILSLVIVTSLTVVLGESVPKVAVLRAPERFALFMAPFMNVFSNIFKWFVNILDWATRLVLSLIGIPDNASHSSAYTLQEIKNIVSGPDVEGVLLEPEREMLTAVIDFSELLVRQVSIPRTEINAVETHITVNEAIQMTMDNTVSKLPVYEGDLDNIVGIVHLRDLVVALQEGDGDKRTVGELARETLFVPETISVNDLVRQFRDSHMHIAIVLDEFGGTYGLVTLEDLLEEIVGEISNPFETEPPPIQKLQDGTVVLNGKVEIEDLNEELGLNLKDLYYDTIAGYVLGKLGRIAKTGDVVRDEENGIILRVDRMDRLRIEQVSLRMI